jgi:hypothetical protein
MLNDKLAVAITCQIRSLQIKCLMYGTDAMVNFNDLFSFIFGSCPALEVFRLNGGRIWLATVQQQHEGALDLNFQSHDYLKCIEMY